MVSSSGFVSLAIMLATKLVPDTGLRGANDWPSLASALATFLRLAKRV